MTDKQDVYARAAEALANSAWFQPVVLKEALTRSGLEIVDTRAPKVSAETVVHDAVAKARKQADESLGTMDRALAQRVERLSKERTSPDMAEIVKRANDLNHASVDIFNGIITQAQYHTVYGAFLTAIRTAIDAAEARGREQAAVVADRERDGFVKNNCPQAALGCLTVVRALRALNKAGEQ